MKTFLRIILCGLWACAPEAQTPQFSQVHLSLDTSRCSDFCIDTVQATLFRPTNPYSPATTPVLTTCEGAQTISFEFNAGTTLFAEVQMSSKNQLVMDGQSSEATVATDQDTQLDVVLEPSLGSGPLIESLEPNPVVEGGQITVFSSEFPEQEGLWAVEVDGEPLSSEGVEWGFESITAALDPGKGGTSLRVRNCGLVSNELALRVLKAQLSFDQHLFSACDDLIDVETFVESESEKALVLCSDSNNGQLIGFDFDSCAVGSTVASFDESNSPGPAQHLSLIGDGTIAWIVFDGSTIQKLDLSNAAQVLMSGDLPTDEPVMDMVCNDDGCTVLSRGLLDRWAIWSVTEDGSGGVTVEPAEATIGLESDESPRALFLSSDALYLVTYDASLNHGRLRKVGATSTTDVALEPCTLPIEVTFAEGKNWVAVSCHDSGLGQIILVDLSSSEVSLGVWQLSVEYDLPRALSFDVEADVLMILADHDDSQQELTILKIEVQEGSPSLSPIQSWPVPDTITLGSIHRATSSNRFVGPSNENELHLFNPYLGSEECLSESVLP